MALVNKVLSIPSKTTISFSTLWFPSAVVATNFATPGFNPRK